MHDLCNCFAMSTQINGKFVPRTNSFGARLALIRWQMGWNMKEAALACGFSQQSWRGWELQGHDPRGFAEVAERIAERTGVDEYWILTVKEPAAPSDPDGGQRSPKLEPVSERKPLDYKVGVSAEVLAFPSRRPHHVEDAPLRIAA
jgi:transcriptional regulator with XRE-family HTH domain